MNLSGSRSWRLGAGVVLTGAALLNAVLANGSPASTHPAADMARTAPAAKAPTPTPLAIPAQVRNQEIVWGTCGLPPEFERNMKCATVAVPRDWNNLAEKIYIPLTVSKTTPANGIDPARAIAMNPGGPGGAGLEIPILFRNHPEIYERFTVIGFDPRGVRFSAPMDCGPVPRTTINYRSRLPSTIAAIKSESKAFLDRCNYFGGRAPVNGRVNLQPVITTEQTVKDIEFMRQVLTKAPTLDFVGYSAGTWMGGFYAAYFPQKAGRMVLDSLTDFPSASWEETSPFQPLGFERNFRELFLPWAAKHDAVYHLGTTPEAAYSVYEKYRWILASLEGVPFETTEFGVTVSNRFDPNLPDDSIPRFLYDKTSWPGLATLMMPWATELAKFEAEHGPVDPGAADPNNDAGAGRRLTGEALTDAIAMVKAIEAAPQTIGAQRKAMTLNTPMLPDRRRSQAAGAGALPAAMDSSAAVFTTIRCNDSYWSRTEQAMARSAEVGKKYPLVGYQNGQSVCGEAPAPARQLIKPIGNPAKPTLFIQAEFDPATPYEEAWQAHTHYAGSVLVKVANLGNHAVFLSGSCADDMGIAYLRDGTLPKPGAAGPVTCDGTLPDPEPEVVDPESMKGARAASAISQAGKSPLTYLAEVVATRTPVAQRALLAMANSDLSARLGN